MIRTAPFYTFGDIVLQMRVDDRELPDSLPVDGLRASEAMSDSLTLLSADEERGIRINFPGKQISRLIARKVRPRLTREVKKYSTGTTSAQAENLLIEGDNLQAMATLYQERGRVDLIITDPPYNTGKDFRYNDRWDEDPNDPGIGEFVSEEDTARHTKWMRFMWPRLQMMKSMLRPGGVLAICIDHRELFRLGPMLDDPELFGAENRIAIINWQRAATRRNDKKSASGGVSIATEYILVYSKDKTKARTGLEQRGVQDAAYKNPDNDLNGEWYGVSPWAPGRSTHPGMVYGAQCPFTGKLHYPPGNQCWSYEKPIVKSWLEEWGSKYEEVDVGDGFPPALVLKGAKNPLRADPSRDPVVSKARRIAEKRLNGTLPILYFTKNGYGRPRKKLYLRDVKQGLVPTTFWASEAYEFPLELDAISWDNTQSGTSEAGARELNAIIGDSHGFETVKPLKLFEKIIQLWCPSDGLVLDPFAGSGTTGHAILRMNESSGVRRRFILIEQGRPENGDSYARTLTAERLKRAISGNWASGRVEALGGGARFVSLDKKVDADTLLRMERDELCDAIIATHFESTRKRSAGLIPLDSQRYRYLIGKNLENQGFFLVWEGPTRQSHITEDVYETCAREAKEAGLTSFYHIYARLYLYQTDNVRFYQIPDRILADFGLDIRSEPFADD